MRKKQRVVLRSKVRRERWDRFRDFFLRKILGLLILAGFAVFAKRFFLHSDFFMIKSVEISERDKKIDQELKSRTSPLRGKTLFAFDSQAWEQDLMKKIPAVTELRIRRSFPNAVKIQYALREPVALMRLAAGSEIAAREFKHQELPKVIDSDGAIFTLTDYRAKTDGLPLVVASSTASCRSAVKFLRLWKTASEHTPLEGSGPIDKVTIDRWEEINLYIADAPSSTAATRIVWGNFEARTFPEKYMRLQEVWSDLQKKMVRAEYVNLREVPQRAPSPLGDRQVVGRVMVRPRKNPAAAKALPAENKVTPNLKPKEPQKT